MEETLLDYLRRKNPIIDHISHKSSKSNTRTPTYTRPKWIAKWEGFDTETLQKMYSDILGRVGTRDAVEPKAIDLRVKDGTGFSDVVLKWNREVVFQALEEAKQYTGHDEIVYMVRGALAKDPPGATKRYRPDWAAIAWAPHEQASRKLEDNRLPGDTKYSKKWKSAWVEEGECRRMFGPEDDYPTWFWPIAQVFTYCHRLETRYAYIITDEELVLFRVGPNRNSPTPTPKSHRLVIEELVSDGKIEFVSVPWTNGRNEEGSELGEPNGLSINTALWWIHLQAASDNSIQWTYPPLENDVLSPRDDSGHSSGVDTQVDTQVEQSPRSAFGHEGDMYDHSFSLGQEGSEFTIPESSALDFGRSPKRRETNRRQAASPQGGSTANTSFVSHSSVTSNKARVSKRKSRSAKRAPRANLVSGNKGGDRGKRI